MKNLYMILAGFVTGISCLINVTDTQAQSFRKGGILGYKCHRGVDELYVLYQLFGF
jgi:hypothetical protein